LAKEFGQHRIIYEIREEEIIILILFIGKHKEYDNFLNRAREAIEEYDRTKINPQPL
jgi:hypothetical protein